MGWEDRPYYRDRGYSSSRLGAFFSGTLPLYTAFGIRVCIHNAMILFILGTLLLGPKGFSLTDRVLSMTALLIVTLLHEYGHCIAAWLTRGSADEIILWPLGGLTLPDSPHRPSARFWTVLGGPLTSGLICLTAAGFVWLLDRHTIVSLNPANLIPSPLPGLTPAGEALTLFFWWIFSVSYLVLLINTLPIFPLDGGHLLQTLLWNFIGNERARVVACLVGMFGAAMLTLVGLALWKWISLAIVFFLVVWLFLSAYNERMILLESGPREPWQTDEHDYSTSLYRDEKPPARRVNKRAVRIARKRARMDAAERERLDAILAKVSATGLASLGWRERRALRAATEKRRKQDEELKGFLEP